MNPVIQAYSRLPINMVRGDGCYLYDDNNKEYIDFASGMGVVSLGHNNDYINQALVTQSTKLWHCYNFFVIPEQQKLAERLTKLSFADSVFFCSSGLEAVETAIKFIRKYQYTIGNTKKNKIITFKNGFHGRSIACLSAGGNSFAREGFGPLLDNFIPLSINDVEAFNNALGDDIAGVIIEPVQSEGGVYPVDHYFLQQVRKITTERDIVLCLDEVQTGFCKTGTLFKYQQIGIEPDIMTVAKALGNGFPLAACLAKKHIADCITPGSHGSTFGGNPLAMAVGNAVLDEMLKPGFIERVTSLSDYLIQKLNLLKNKYPENILDIRYSGLIVGIEINFSAKDMVKDFCSNGLVATKAGNDRVIRLLPPLIITEEIIDKAIRIMDNCFLKKSNKE